MYIGKKLKEILKHQSISLAELSERSGIGRQECEAFLKEQKEPTLETFVQIVNALGALPSDFIETGRSDATKLLSMQTKVNELSLEKQKELFETIKIFLP